MNKEKYGTKIWAQLSCYKSHMLDSIIIYKYSRNLNIKEMLFF